MRKIAISCALLVLFGVAWHWLAGLLRTPDKREGLRDAPARAGFRDLADLHRRPDAPDEGCIWCHPEDRRAGGAPATDPSRWIATAGRSPAVDGYAVGSRACLACHDGLLAGTARDYAQEGRWALTGQLSGSHPIGMDYLRVAQLRPGQYRSPMEGDGIRLEKGLVGCPSCHVGHRSSREVAGPAATAAGLCQNCHRY